MVSKALSFIKKKLGKKGKKNACFTSRHYWKNP